MDRCRSRPAGGMAYAADLKSAFCGFESRAGYHFQPQKDSNRCRLLPFRLFISRFRRFSKSKQDFGNQTRERAKLFPEVEMAAPRRFCGDPPINQVRHNDRNQRSMFGQAGRLQRYGRIIPPAKNIAADIVPCRIICTPHRKRTETGISSSQKK